MSNNTIAIVLYGIGRGGDLCKHSIERNVLDHLPSSYNVHVLEVRDDIEYIDNNRSEEKGEVDVKSFYFELSDKYIINAFNEEVFLKWNKSQKYIDIHKDDYQSNKNLLKQLYLLRYAYDKLKKMPELPQYVISLRDDILWTSPLKSENAFAFIEQFPNSYFTSCYYWNGGISERFFISNFDVASLIMNRFKHIDSYFRHMDKLSYVERKGLNAEWLNRYIIEKYGIEVVSQKIITPRVRIGSRVKKDNLLPRPWRLGCYCRAQLSRFRFSIWKFTKWFKIW